MRSKPNQTLALGRALRSALLASTAFVALACGGTCDFAWAQYPIAPTAPLGDSSQKIANTSWVNTALASALARGTVFLSGCANVQGTGVDDGAAIQACLTATATAGKALVVDTPSYVDPQGNHAWLVCASPNNDGHGISLPASATIIGSGWQTRIEMNPNCGAQGSARAADVFYAGASTSTSSGLIQNLALDGEGLATPLNAYKWARYTLIHDLIRNGTPGSFATFPDGPWPDALGHDLLVEASRIENTNDTGHTIYWGSRLFANASASQNQIVLPSIPAGLVQGGAVDLLQANGHNLTCSGTAGSYFVNCASTTGAAQGDRIIIGGGGALSTTLAANAGVSATTITLTNVNGVGPGDTIVITGAGTSGSDLTTQVTSFPTITTAPAGTVSIANAVVTGVSSGANVALTTPFYGDIAAVSPAGNGCTAPCLQLNNPITANITNAIVVDPTRGYNFSTSGMPLSVAVAYACAIAGTTVSLSTSPTDTTCSTPYNLPTTQVTGTWVTNLPIFTVADAGADSVWSDTYAVSGARAEFAAIQNEGDTRLTDVHVFGPPPLNALYGIEFTGGGICVSCQNDRAQWAGLKVGNKSVLANANVTGFISERAAPDATAQIQGVRIDTGAIGAVVTGVQQGTGQTQVIPPAQIVVQTGTMDPSEKVFSNPGAALVTQGTICQATWGAGNAPSVTNNTGTTVETQLAACAIPGGLLGPNDGLRISTLYQFNNTANAKTPKIRWDPYPGALVGTAPLAVSSGTGGAVTAGCSVIFRNQGATNAQIGLPGTASCPDTAVATLSASAGARDTTVPFWVDASCVTSVSGDTCTLLTWTVEILKSF